MPINNPWDQTRSISLAKDIVLKESPSLQGRDLSMFKLGIEKSSDAVFLTDVDGKIIFVNPAFEKLYGYSKEEAIGKTPRILKSGKLSNKVYAQFWKCLLNKEIVAGEIINKTRDGRLITVDASANPVLDSSGRLIGFLAVQRDITNRKIAENIEKAKAEFLAGLVGSNGIGEICRLAFDFIRVTMACDAGAIVLKKERNHEASFEVVYHFDTDAEGAISVKENSKVFELNSASRIAQVFRNGQKIIVHRTEDELKKIIPTRPTKRIFNAHPSKSLAYFPLKFRNQTVGILTAQSYSPDSYGEDAANLLEFVATNLAMALMAVITSETLRESEERFRGIFENSTIGLYRTTPDGQILMANSALIRMLGFNSFKDLAARNIEQYDYHHSHSRKVFREMVERLGVIHGFESTWTKSDGSYITVRESTRRVSDKDGNSVYYEGTVEDITERKRAEEALRESEERYRLLIENAHDAIIVIQDGKVVFGNQALLNLHGHTMEEILDKPFAWLIHPDDREMVSRNYLARTAGKPVDGTYSFRVLHKDGSARWVEINVVAIEWNKKKAMIYFGRDITHRMETEKALRENEERFRTIFETGPLPMALSGESYKFFKANEAFCNMLGYTEEELSHLTFKDITHPDNLPDDIEAVRRVGSGELPNYKTEKRYLKKDGSVVWGSITLSRIIDKEGRLSNMLAMVQDITEQKDAENQLLIEKAYLEKLFASAPEAVVMVDNNNRIIRINSEFSRMFGWSLEEAIGKSVDELLAPDVLHEDAIILSHQVSCGETINVEGIRYRKDGQPVFVSILSTPISSSGSQIAAYGIYRDITERKKTEAKINRINRVYSVLSAINEAIVRISEVNQLFEQSCRIAVEQGGFRMAWVGLVNEQTGLVESVASDGNVDGYLKEIKIAAAPIAHGQGPTGTCIRENRHVICNNIDTDPHMAPWREKALKRGYRSSAAFPIRSGSKVIGTFNLYAGEPDFFSDDETQLLLALANDISFAIASIERENQRMKAEEALKESEEKYRNLIETMPNGLAIIDLEWNIKFANRAACVIFGYSLPRITEKNLRDLITDKSLPGFEKEMLRRRWGQSGEYEIQIRQGGENIRTLFVTAVALRNRSGDVIGSIGIFSDVTEIRKSETEKQELRDKLARAQKMESLGILAGGVAHDLNNILGPLVAYPELIRMKLSPENPIIHQISKIESSAQRAAEVVQDLLTMARRGRYEMKPVSINKVVNGYLQSADFLEMKSHFPNLTVDVNLHSENRLMYGSEPHLYKVIMNLVINALDAMPHGGKLTVKSECRQVERLIGGFDNIEKGIYTILTVSDTGIGVDLKDIKRLFEPFYTKKTMGKSGSGLGLAIVYGIVKDHNGYIDIRSEANKGSDFIIYLPTTSDAGVWVELEPTSIRGDERILIVDDVPEQRELAVTILGSLGYSAESVSNGHEALELLKNTSVDVVVLDMIMEPGFDGLDTYQGILKIRPGQKAIITSGYSETERVKEAEKLGVGKYIRKPYTMQTLGKAIREVLDQPEVISLK